MGKLCWSSSGGHGEYFAGYIDDTYYIILKEEAKLEGSVNGLIIAKLEVKGFSGPQLLVCGPSSLLDFVLPALRALRVCDDDSIVHICIS